MGLSNKKSTSQTNTSSTATSTPNVPSWLMDTTQGINTQIQNLGKADPYSFVASTNGAQSQALDQATELAGKPNGLFGEAAQAYRDAPQVQAASLLDGLDKYYNPFKSQVLDPVLNDFDVNAGRTRAAQAAQAAGTHAFSGSRYGVREAQTEGELARGRAATEGGLLGGMYDSATALSGQDAQRRQAASESNSQLALSKAAGLAGLGSAEGADSRANIGLLAGLGNDQYTRDTTTAQAPLDLLKTQTGLLAGINPSDYIGKTVNETGDSRTTNKSISSLGSDLGNIAKIAALFI